MVVGTTNRPDALDPALRRAGRFDRELAMGIPDKHARRKILEVMARGLRLSESIDFGVLADKTPGYVGADLSALCREAGLGAIDRVFKDLGRSSERVPPEQLLDLAIEVDDFEIALTKVQPSSRREGFSCVPDVSWEDVGSLASLRAELEPKLDLTPS